MKELSVVHPLTGVELGIASRAPMAKLSLRHLITVRPAGYQSERIVAQIEPSNTGWIVRPFGSGVQTAILLSGALSYNPITAPIEVPRNQPFSLMHMATRACVILQPIAASRSFDFIDREIALATTKVINRLDDNQTR